MSEAFFNIKLLELAKRLYLFGTSAGHGPCTFLRKLDVKCQGARWGNSIYARLHIERWINPHAEVLSYLGAVHFTIFKFSSPRHSLKQLRAGHKEYSEGICNNLLNSVQERFGGWMFISAPLLSILMQQVALSFRWTVAPWRI